MTLRPELDYELVEVFGVPTIKYQPGVLPTAPDFHPSVLHWNTQKQVPEELPPWLISGPWWVELLPEFMQSWFKRPIGRGHYFGKWVDCKEWGRQPQIASYIVLASNPEQAMKNLRDYIKEQMLGVEAKYLSCYHEPGVVSYYSEYSAHFDCGFIKTLLPLPDCIGDFRS